MLTTNGNRIRWQVCEGNHIETDIRSIYLTIIFLILKALRIIDWQWKWILSPLWLPFALAIGLVVVIGLFKAITGK